jgi:hypothetical protein
MKKLTAILIMALATCSLFAQDIAGTWNGSFSVQGQTLRINFNISETDEGYTSTLDSPDQNAFGIAVDTTTFKNQELRIVINQLNFVYTGKLEGEDKIDGGFTQMGQSFEMDMTKKEE